MATEHPWGPPVNRKRENDDLRRCLREFISACENEPDGENYRPHIGKAMVNNAKKVLGE